MAFTYPLTLPAEFHSADVTIRPDSVSASHMSPDTYSEQVQERVGQRWVIDIQLPKMSRAAAETVIATFLKLNGRTGTFYMGDPANKLPRGTATAGGAPGPRCNGTATARSSSLSTTGWAASQASLLLAGDWIQVGTGSSARLHKVLTNAASNGSGNATLDIWPWCRTAYASGTAIVADNAVGIFRLVETPQWNIDLARFYGLRIAAAEAV